MRKHGELKRLLLDILPRSNANDWMPALEIGAHMTRQGVRNWRASLTSAVRVGDIVRRRHDLTQRWTYARASSRR